jgi:hypothetical protein
MKNLMVGENYRKAVNLKPIPKFRPEMARKVWRCPIDTKIFGLFTQALAEADAEEGAFSSLVMSVGTDC